MRELERAGGSPSGTIASLSGARQSLSALAVGRGARRAQRGEAPCNLPKPLAKAKASSDGVYGKGIGIWFTVSSDGVYGKGTGIWFTVTASCSSSRFF